MERNTENKEQERENRAQEERADCGKDPPARIVRLAGSCLILDHPYSPALV
jgi:hypothetical protein